MFIIIEGFKMENAIDADFGELIVANDIFSVYGYFAKYHLFICPLCNIKVSWVDAKKVRKYFKHKFSSPECERYTGGSEYATGKVSSAGVIYKFQL